MKHIKTYMLFESDNGFDGWFGKSKVVGRDGRSMAMYHGTNTRFEKFERSAQGRTDDGFYGKGFYFSPSKEEAKEYGSHVIEAYLRVENPFWLRTNSSSDSIIMLDLRDDLSKLTFMPDSLKTNRKLPEGYKVKVRDGGVAHGRKTVSVAVWPEPELYGTDREEYGPDQVYYESDYKKEDAELSAIVEFNDMMAGVDWSVGWTTSLLKVVGRDSFTENLKSVGYDGVFVVGVNELGEVPSIENVHEVIVFDPGQIKSTTNSRFDVESENIYEYEKLQKSGT
jgi:hypothetical protein